MIIFTVHSPVVIIISPVHGDIWCSYLFCDEFCDRCPNMIWSRRLCDNIFHYLAVFAGDFPLMARSFKGLVKWNPPIWKAQNWAHVIRLVHCLNFWKIVDEWKRLSGSSFRNSIPVGVNRDKWFRTPFLSMCRSLDDKLSINRTVQIQIFAGRH